ncbi:MAG TPA: hypothetical protein VF598_01780 [Hymenobacter sp.]|jgi:hypothetical protein
MLDMDIHISTGDGTNWQGWLTALVALAVCVVTTLSYLVNRQKLRLDLFEHRFELYRQMNLLMEKSDDIGARTATEHLEHWHRCIAEARYMFGPAVAKAVGEVEHEIDKMVIQNIFLDAKRGIDDAGYFETMKQKLEHYVAAVNKMAVVRNMLIPYIDFSKVGLEGQLTSAGRQCVKWYKKQAADYR